MLAYGLDFSCDRVCILDDLVCVRVGHPKRCEYDSHPVCEGRQLLRSSVPRAVVDHETFPRAELMVLLDNACDRFPYEYLWL